MATLSSSWFVLVSLLLAFQQTNGFLLPCGGKNHHADKHHTRPSSSSSRLFGVNNNEDDSENHRPQQQQQELPKGRRDLFRDAASAGALASLLAATSFVPGVSSSPAAAAEEGSLSLQQPQQTIVVTGANSGVGFEACRRLARQDHRLVLSCRTLQKAEDAIGRLHDDATTTAGVLVPAECDLANLSSIRAFADRLPTLIGKGERIDCLCLNAGLARNTAAADVARTSDGFELTVGTNHFGHFYLNHLLLSMLDAKSGRIVVTASSVHDPDSPGGAQGERATLGDLQGLERDGIDCEMVDGAPFNADKAYKDSKLCNVLFTRELQRRLSSNANTRGIVANCFTPGLIVSTGLFRDQNPLFTKVFDFAATDLLKVGETPAFGGGCLAYTTTVDTAGGYYTSDPGTSKYGDAAYGNQFTIGTPSVEARDDAKAKRLWELSEKLLGVSTAI